MARSARIAGPAERLLRLHDERRPVSDAELAVATRVWAAFRACQAPEEAAFMGDASFWQYLQRPLTGPRPLLRWTEGAPPAFPPATHDDRRFVDCALELTASGHACLEGRLDHVAVNDCRLWMGGVRQWPGRVWRYDRTARRLIAPGNAASATTASRNPSPPVAGKAL